MTDRLTKCRVLESGRLVDALRALEEGAVEIAFITDSSNKLLGLVTDGDIRRALLQGAALDTPIAPYMQRRYISVSQQTPRAEVLDIMNARKISQIPVVDQSGILVGIHLLREVVGVKERSNWAVVMAGGRGVRLKPITDTLPKPMIRIAGRPIVERIILHLISFGIRRIFLSVNYLGHMIEEHFGDGQSLGCKIEYLREDKPLGTGGPLTLLPELPTEPFVVMNGDLVTQAAIDAMIDFHVRGGQVVTIGARRYFHSVPFGCLEMDGTRIVRMEEKPRMTQLVNTGIYVVSPDLLSDIPRGEDIGMPTLIERRMQAGQTVRAFEIEDDWIDVGQREQLQRAREGEA